MTGETKAPPEKHNCGNSPEDRSISVKYLKTLSLAAALASSVTLAFGFEVTGHPAISDGTNSISLNPNGGEFRIKICNTTYYLADSNSWKMFNNMKARMDSNGGYVYANTDAPGNKRWYYCAWGRYEHLHGTLF